MEQASNGVEKTANQAEAMPQRPDKITITITLDTTKSPPEVIVGGEGWQWGINDEPLIDWMLKRAARTVEAMSNNEQANLQAKAEQTRQLMQNLGVDASKVADPKAMTNLYKNLREGIRAR